MAKKPTPQDDCRPPTIVKFIFAIVWDILDATIFRIPGLGTITDFIGGVLAYKFFGLLGVAYWWELFDITDQIDAEVPTMTAIAILDYLRNRGH